MTIIPLTQLGTSIYELMAVFRVIFKSHVFIMLRHEMYLAWSATEIPGL
jgi:hypothetical protein